MLSRPLPALPADIALVVGRVVLGVVLFAHGWQKLVVDGIGETSGQFEKLGVPLAIVSASFAAFVEFTGGALLIVGALTTTVVTLDALVMVGAAGFVHVTHGVFAQDGGWELVGVIVAAELALAATGPGRFSVDHLVVSRRAAQDREVRTPLADRLEPAPEAGGEWVVGSWDAAAPGREPAPMFRPAGPTASTGTPAPAAAPEPAGPVADAAEDAAAPVEDGVPTSSAAVHGALMRRAARRAAAAPTPFGVAAQSPLDFTATTPSATPVPPP